MCKTLSCSDASYLCRSYFYITGSFEKQKWELAVLPPHPFSPASSTSPLHPRESSQPPLASPPPRTPPPSLQPPPPPLAHPHPPTGTQEHFKRLVICVLLTLQWRACSSFAQSLSQRSLPPSRSLSIFKMDSAGGIARAIAKPSVKKRPAMAIAAFPSRDPVTKAPEPVPVLPKVKKVEHGNTTVERVSPELLDLAVYFNASARCGRGNMLWAGWNASQWSDTSKCRSTSPAAGAHL